ncbi:MAG: DUF2807 domain-containing protein [Sphingobacteriales bacterium]|nr:MAG: DUF2807 domain-containing protein [Sphingobacteriales bacterium]
MKKYTALMLLSFMMLFSSCYYERYTLRGEGETISETRDLPAFRGFEANGDIRVEVYPATRNRVVVTGYQNLVREFETDVNSGLLRLQFDDEYRNIRNNNIVIRLYTSSLESVYLNGSGDVKVHAGQEGERIEAIVNGSGVVDLGDNVYYEADLKVNGSGYINSRGVEADDVYAEISGSGNMDLTARRYLFGRVYGSGTINYWGNPAEQNVSVSGSGRIRKK